MKRKRSGERISYTYRVLDVFPFVQGVLYYSAVEGGDWGSGGESQLTRFVLAVGEWKREEKARKLVERDDAAFFPVEEDFVDEGVLYWVFRPLEGDLLAHRLLKAGPLPLGEVQGLLSTIFSHARRLAPKGEYAVVAPLNILETKDGQVRFLYGGAASDLPGSIIPDVEKQWVFDIASLAYQLLTGQPLPDGAAVPSLRRQRREIPAALDVLIRQALSPKAAARPTLNRLEKGFMKALEAAREAPPSDASGVPAKPTEGGFHRAGGNPRRPCPEVRKGALRPSNRPPCLPAGKWSGAPGSGRGWTRYGHRYDPAGEESALHRLRGIPAVPEARRESPEVGGGSRDRVRCGYRRVRGLSMAVCR